MAFTGKGLVPSDTAPIMDVAATNALQNEGGVKSSSSVPTLKVSLMVPLQVPAAGSEDSSSTPEGTSASSTVTVSDFAGQRNLIGLVHGVAYVAKREPFGKAISEIKVICRLSLELPLLP